MRQSDHSSPETHRNSVVRIGWKRVRFGELGDNVRFGGRSVFNRPENIHVGSDVFFGADCYFEAVSSIVIGSGCMFGPRVFCIAGSHNYESPDLRAIPYDNRQIDLPVRIEDNVWVGGNVSIAPGAHIGEGSIIGMGAIVAGKIPPLSIVMCEKGQVVRSRDEAQYSRLKQEGRLYSRLYAGQPFEMIGKKAR